LEVIIHCEIIQKQWAKEHDYKILNCENWMHEILCAQILWYKPDVVYASTLGTFPLSLMKELKRKLGKATKWICYYGTKSDDIKVDFGEYDVVFTGFIPNIKHLNHAGIKSIFFPHYFDYDLSQKALQIKENDINFSFVGNISVGGTEFNERRDYILALIKSVNLRIWSQLNEENCNRKEFYRILVHEKMYDLYQFLNRILPCKVTNSIPFICKYSKFEKRPDSSVFIHPKIKTVCTKAVFGAEMYKILRRSKLTFNSYIRMDSRCGEVPYPSGNIRTFEATSVGTCLLTKHCNDLHHFFEPDVEVAVYRNIDEAIEKAQFLLKNKLERKKIATAGFNRAHRDHSSKVRAKQFLDILKNVLH
jgi:glycosyltransferase involved in cell wall biosynthesis